MKALIINAEEYTPRVIFDPGPGTFEIVGESRPEDVRTFYEPVLSWLDDFRAHLAEHPEERQKYELNIVLEYFNSTSAKFVLDLLMKIDELFADGNEFVVDWHYETIDEDMKEAGEEFDKLTTVPFKFTVI